MALRYEALGRLSRGHVDGVSAVAFSARGTYLASAGVQDCTVYIWRVNDQKLLHKFTSSSTTLSLLWLPGREDALLCGLQGGAISSVLIGSSTLQASGFWAHNYPVEHLSAKGSFLASGAKSEVAIWKREDRHWENIMNLPMPPTNSFNKDSEVLVTSIHWTKSSTHSSLLLITYMFHGISMYDTTNWRAIRHVPLQGPIAHASVSPDGTTIAISNMVSGFDLYDLNLQAPFRRFSHAVGALRAVPVLLVHGGHALLGGSTTGDTHLWNVHNGLLHQTLSLGAENAVMSIAAHYEADIDRFLIATGIANAGSAAPVVIWVARDGRRRSTRASRRRAPQMSCVVYISIAVIGLAVACVYYYYAPLGVL